jgi:SAM-dependent methyltransferase
VVTGSDFSGRAIAAARELSARLQLSAAFVCAENPALPDLLDRRFDIVYTSYGVLPWLPGLAEWAKAISALLNPGGLFYLADSHALLGMFGDSFGSFEASYFHGTDPRVFVEDGSYADRAAKLVNKTSCEWQHSLSDLINALISHGLEVTVVREFPYYLFFQRFDQMTRCEDGWWRLPGEERFPLMFSILATAP